MAHAGPPARPLAPSFPQAAWQVALNWTAALLLAALFLVAGVWKLTGPLDAASRMTQALVPGPLSIPAALAFGIAETFAAVLLIVPRFRRWGAWLSGLLLLAFMVYIGINYTALQGEECNCFPWVKRAVGPAFFIGDAVMLLLAALAAMWVRPSSGVRNALIILAAITVFGGVMLGVTFATASGVRAPDSVLVDGKPFPLQQGRVFLYFFDPECSHCNEAAIVLGRHRWKDVRLLSTATTQQQWAQVFLNETKFHAALTAEVKKLRETFQFTDPPYGVALDNGRQVAAFPFFDSKEPETTLRKLGFIE